MSAEEECSATLEREDKTRISARKIWVREKSFLVHLWKATKHDAKHLIYGATDVQLKGLVLLLSFIAKGEVHLSQDTVDAMCSRRENALVRGVDLALKADRCDKQKFLRKFLRDWHGLIEPLLK